jgi:uncharacterized membrane protein
MSTSQARNVGDVQRRSEGRVVGLTLRLGAYVSIAVIGAGLVAGLFTPRAQHITSIGIVLLIATPVVRVMVAFFVFVRERDTRYALVSLTVFTIMVVTSLLAFLGVIASEH